MPIPLYCRPVLHKQICGQVRHQVQSLVRRPAKDQQRAKLAAKTRVKPPLAKSRVKPIVKPPANSRIKPVAKTYANSKSKPSAQVFAQSLAHPSV
uniref:Uncharacterized protein n=1 Tax=Ditylenchus dipsaci TaxID=166011 RepID=A0A915EEE2_9BILA